MQRATVKARQEFIALIYEHIPPIDAKKIPETVYRRAHFGLSPHLWFAEKMLRYGATLGRIAENQCNGYQTYDYKWDEKAAKRDEAKEARIVAKVEKLCAAFGCKPVFQGDPRGNTLKIMVPGGYTNDWGREGICVPTS